MGFTDATAAVAGAHTAPRPAVWTFSVTGFTFALRTLRATCATCALRATGAFPATCATCALRAACASRAGADR